MNNNEKLIADLELRISKLTAKLSKTDAARENIFQDADSIRLKIKKTHATIARLEKKLLRLADDLKNSINGVHKTAVPKQNKNRKKIAIYQLMIDNLKS